MESFRTNILLLNFVYGLYRCGETMLDTTTRLYILQSVCSQIDHSNSSICHNIKQYPDIENEIQKQAGHYFIIYRIIINAPAFILALFCGAFSDKYGRKLPMTLPSIGSISAVFFYIASLIYLNVQLPLIFIGTAFQGICGKSPIVAMAVSSYISDITKKHERIRHLGTALATCFLGICLGNFLSGVIQDIFNKFITFCGVIFLQSICILFVTACLPESNKNSEYTDNNSKTLKSFFDLSNIKESFAIITSEKPNGGRRFVLILLLIMLLNQLCRIGEQDVTILFVSRSPLNWPKPWYGYLLSYEYALMGFCLYFVLPVLSAWMKISDVSFLIFGLCCKIARLIVIAFATKTWMVVLAVSIGSFAGIVPCACKSLLSKLIQANEAGKIFSLIAFTETASKVLGVISFVNVYTMTADTFAGIAYLVEASCFVFMLFLVLCDFKVLKSAEQYNVLKNSKNASPCTDQSYDVSSSTSSENSDNED